MSDTPRTEPYRGRWATAFHNGKTIFDHACELECELDAATLELANRAGAIEYAQKLRSELAAVTKQRDDARAELAVTGVRMASEDRIAYLEAQLEAAAMAIGSPKDKHRLAEALTSVLASYRARCEKAEADRDAAKAEATRYFEQLISEQRKHQEYAKNQIELANRDRDSIKRLADMADNWIKERDEARAELEREKVRFACMQESFQRENDAKNDAQELLAKCQKERTQLRAELADEKAARIYATSARDDVERHLAQAYEAFGVTVLESEEGVRLPVLVERLLAELAEARECLRDAIGWVEAPRNLYNHERWRKASGVDA